jgi:hypothetical protein
MNSLRTLDGFYQAICDSLAWRKRELTTVKQMIQRSRKDAHQQACLLRGGIALLYAHWEGFIREASTAYLSFVASQRLKYGELSPNFVGFSMKESIRLMESSNRASVCTSVAEFFINDMDKESEIPWKDGIKVGGNLSSSVLKEVLYTLGMAYAEYEIKEKVIDERLLRNRNNIAHGQYLMLTEEEFSEVRDDILVLMDTFMRQLSNAAALQRYRRPPA